MQLASDPSVMRLRGIVERAEVLLMPSVHVSYSVLDVGVGNCCQLSL